ncbi:MAG: WYL domain-containing transcriptional regulator [Spirochaetales bacterium]|uniref:WYL domain-containing transcriptional regulator n=1 Tax=Candidatus Thalassospirochaeta sargassi TaxID=3119039 RepID=A0AAJ1IE17_9SPIO|nr:WYL domain-containing transcriptional regulator [Spirochaetales bacterium]
MNRALTKSERLNKIQLLLASCAGGLTRAELSRRLGVSKSSISRDIVALSHDCSLIEDEETRKLYLEKISLLTNLHLNAEEIQALHLACRLLGRKVRFQYPSASSALRKFGTALENYAAPLASSITSTAELFETHDKKNLSDQASKIKIITEGIVRGLSIRCERYSRREEKWKDCLFSSYCIEPYAEGNSLYIVGFDEDYTEIRTIKFELIKNIELTDRPYSIPPDFCTNEYFKNSWGIWVSENELQQVVLIFSEKVKPRVLQTEWHSSEETCELPDGRLRWTAEIAEPKEMLPWIRGWGADVEVIEPQSLRQLIIDDIEACVTKYGLRMLS